MRTVPLMRLLRDNLLVQVRRGEGGTLLQYLPCWLSSLSTLSPWNGHIISSGALLGYEPPNPLGLLCRLREASRLAGFGPPCPAAFFGDVFLFDRTLQCWRFTVSLSQRLKATSLRHKHIFAPPPSGAE